MATDTKSNMTIIYIILAVIIAVLIIAQVQKENDKSRFERAADDISEGFNDAADELKDKGPLERTGDAVEDAVDNVTKD